MPKRKVKIVELEHGRKTIWNPAAQQATTFQFSVGSTKILLAQYRREMFLSLLSTSVHHWFARYMYCLLTTTQVHPLLTKLTTLAHTSPVAIWTLQVLVDLRHLRFFFNLSSLVWLKPNPFLAYMLVSSSFTCRFWTKDREFQTEDTEPSGGDLR